MFVVFGSLLTFGGLFDDGWATVAIVVGTLLVARPVAVVIALAGTRTSRAATAFMEWVGPKGVATMTFSLLVLSSEIADDARIFNIAALTVLVSIIAHGLTDTPGAEWMARRAEAEAEAEPWPSGRAPLSPQDLSVERGLLLGVREGPGCSGAALLPEYEAHLLRWPQSLG